MARWADKVCGIREMGGFETVVWGKIKGWREGRGWREEEG
jgi:hypothetical protein